MKIKQGNQYVIALVICGRHVINILMGKDNHPFEMENFKREQREAMLSLDQEKIRAFVRKWNKVEMPQHPIAFWGAVHKCITGIVALPLDFRKDSKKWLDDNNMQSMDDGDL